MNVHKVSQEIKMILDEIVEDCQVRLETRKSQSPLEKIKRLAIHKARPLDLALAVRGEKIQIIAEIKKASPSKGLICRDFNPIDIAKTYFANGAAAISILTEEDHFQGKLDYLSYVDCALGSVRPPLLRKDFIFDPYQVYESRAFGADALLLIVAILGPQKLQELLDLSHKLHLSCLVEVHNKEEAGIAVKSGAQIIGINNRDLRTFDVDTTITERLRPLIPPDRIVVSESGIKTREDIQKLKKSGVDAVLIGESLMASRDIAAKFRELR